MSFLFTRSKPKTPQEVVYSLNALLCRPDVRSDPKLLEEIHRLLAQTRIIAYGDLETPPDPDQMSALSKEIYDTGLLEPLLQHMSLFSFEGRRDMTQLFTFLLQRQIGGHSPTVEYILQRPRLVDMIIEACGNPDTHRNANSILVEFSKHEPLQNHVLNSVAFWDFFSYLLELPFEVASDCFSSFSRFVDPSSRNTTLFLQKYGTRFKDEINRLLMCQNYVIKRQAIKLQATLINHRKNKDYITAYVKDLENIKVVLRLLGDKSRAIQFEAFHLFKVFVANPQKPRPIHTILVRNRPRIVEILKSLQSSERKDDPQFTQERIYVLHRINELELDPESA